MDDDFKDLLWYQRTIREESVVKNKMHKLLLKCYL